MKNVSFLKLDMLRELGSIGAGRAATSLSELVSTQVNIAVPDIRLYPFQKIIDLFKEEEYFILRADLSGDIMGVEFLLLSIGETRALSGMLLGMEPAAVNVDDEMAQSSLKEAANILLSSYMNALSDLTGFSILAGVPELHPHIHKTEVEKCITEIPTTDIICVKSHLAIERMGFDALVLFVPAEKSLQTMFTKLGLPE
ncbi:MAG: chemotaxis protein CheC [Candidatus Paceibacterota bacterium]|jgi:chemotaxis protein CheC